MSVADDNARIAVIFGEESGWNVVGAFDERFEKGGSFFDDVTVVDEAFAADGSAHAAGADITLKMLHHSVHFLVRDAFVDQANGASAATSAR